MFRMPEVLHNICNMGGRDLPDMSALALGRCAPSGSCVHIRQITPAHVTYITWCIIETQDTDISEFSDVVFTAIKPGNFESVPTSSDYN